MSWYKDSLNNILKQYQYEPDSSKMPCVRFSKQDVQTKPCNCQKTVQDLQHLHNKEETLNELV